MPEYRDLPLGLTAVIYLRDRPSEPDEPTPRDMTEAEYVRYCEGLPPTEEEMCP